MLEQAVHEFNRIWSVVGAHPVRAWTMGRSGIIPGRNTTNYYTTILEYPGNLIVHYSHGWIQVPGFPHGGLRIDFIGKDGALDIMGVGVPGAGDRGRRVPPRPRARKAKTVAEMKALAKGKGLRFLELHHEIGLSDPRRAPEARLRTTLRQPVR